jgi:hypothetical protein
MRLRADAQWRARLLARDEAAGEAGISEENWDLCNRCGGLCCCLYLAHDENGEYIGDGWLPEYIDLWTSRLVESGALVATGSAYGAGEAGIEPLHDPRLSHLPNEEGAAYRSGLPEWVDVRKCQFCHSGTGCLLPRRYRAPICGSYRCELWLEAGSGPS